MPLATSYRRGQHSQMDAVIYRHTLVTVPLSWYHTTFATWPELFFCNQLQRTFFSGLTFSAVTNSISSTSTTTHTKLSHSQCLAPVRPSQLVSPPPVVLATTFVLTFDHLSLVRSATIDSFLQQLYGAGGNVKVAEKNFEGMRRPLPPPPPGFPNAFHRSYTDYSLTD